MSYEIDRTSSGASPMAGYVLPHYAVLRCGSVSDLTMHVLSLWLRMNMTQGERYRLSIADITPTVVSVENAATEKNVTATRSRCHPKEYIFGISRDTVSNFSHVHVNSRILNTLYTCIVRHPVKTISLLHLFECFLCQYLIQTPLLWRIGRYLRFCYSICPWKSCTDHCGKCEGHFGMVSSCFVI
jgi:hypothetical protein